MSELFHVDEEPQFICWDRANYTEFKDQLEAVKNSKTVYIGNLSFFTTEAQIRATFSFAGPVKRIIMGLNNLTKTPCGFCFVEYFHQEHAYNAIKYLSDTVCDERMIRCDSDGGFLPGRQFGRGKSGGQIRDEWRTDYDPARGRFIPPSILGKSHYNNRKRGYHNDEQDNGRDRNDQHPRDNYNDRNQNYQNKRSRFNHESHHSYNTNYVTHQPSHDSYHDDRYRDDNNNYRDNNNYDNTPRNHNGGRKQYRVRDRRNERGYSDRNYQQPQDMEVTLNSSLQTGRD